MTVQNIYDMAIHLMDEQNESTGKTETVDTNEYKFRTISILNTVIPVLYPYSSGYDGNKPGRPVCQLLYVEDYRNPDFDQEIPLDDDLSAALLPYFLAAQLLSGENESLAAWFLSRYRDTFFDIRNQLPAEFTPIRMPYGAF